MSNLCEKYKSTVNVLKACSRNKQPDKTVKATEKIAVLEFFVQY